MRNSINNLAKPINIFSNSLNTLDKNISKYNDSLSKLKVQHEAIASSGEYACQKLTVLSGRFSSILTILHLVRIQIKGWTIALSGGLAIVTASLPEIINLATAFFKGKDAVSQMVTNLKNLNEVMKASNSDIAA